jgi:hypothetical protein
MKFSDLGLISFNSSYFGNLNFQRKSLYNTKRGFKIIPNQKKLIEFIFDTDTLMFPSLMYKGGIEYSSYLMFDDSSVGDVIFYCSLAKNYKIGIVYMPLYNYRRHITQHSNRIPYIDLKILHRHFSSVSDNNVENSNFIFNRYIAYYRSKFIKSLNRRLFISSLLINKFGFNNLSVLNLSRVILFLIRI